jgi:hypothetical protein
MGSRVRIAAAACLVACGLLAGGACASLAFAAPLLTSGDSGDKHTNGSVGNGSADKPKSDPDERKTPPGGDGKEDQPGTHPVDPKAGDDKKDGDNGKGDGKDGGADNGSNGDKNNGGNGVGNPGKGNCGNSGSNGNAGCGGGSGNSDPDDPPTTKPATIPTKEEPPPPEEPGQCDDKNKDHCSPGWPWPWPRNPGQPPGPGGGGGGGTAPEVPSGRPHVPPQMQLPSELMPPETEPGPTVIDAEPGVGIAAAQLPIAPITLPVIVAPATGLGGGGGSPGAPTLPVTPRGVSAEPPAGREPLPANVGSNVAVPATSYRIGYTEYLRNAGLSQVAALAVPGLAGMLVLTGAGGLVGYRQAKAGHAVHTSGTARFVN